MNDNSRHMCVLVRYAAPCLAGDRGAVYLELVAISLIQVLLGCNYQVCDIMLIR
jgi:hypothetical protein